MALPTASDNAFPSVLVTEGSAPTAPAAGKKRLYIDSSDHHLKTKDSASAIVDLQAAAASYASDVKVQTSGTDYTTTSGTYADIDATNLSSTITTGAHRVKIAFTFTWQHSSTANTINIDLLADGSSVTGLGNGFAQLRPVRNSENTSLTLVYITAAQTAASHTFKLQWKTNGGTATIARTGFATMWVVEELAY